MLACVYVYIYAYVCIYIYTHTYIYIYIYRYIYIHIDIYIYIYTCYTHICIVRLCVFCMCLGWYIGLAWRKVLYALAKEYVGWIEITYVWVRLYPGDSPHQAQLHMVAVFVIISALLFGVCIRARNFGKPQYVLSVWGLTSILPAALLRRVTWSLRAY